MYLKEQKSPSSTTHGRCGRSERNVAELGTYLQQQRDTTSLIVGFRLWADDEDSLAKSCPFLHRHAAEGPVSGETDLDPTPDQYPTKNKKKLRAVQTVTAELWVNHPRPESDVDLV